MKTHDRKVVFSSNSDEYSTPQNLYDKLNLEFGFTLDPCATFTNHKCRQYFTTQDNGLEKDWSKNVVFCNPPYSKVKDWIKKGYQESLNGVTSVFLVPARTDTRWFKEFVMHASEVRFISGRLKFNGMKTSAPFPSMIVVFTPGGKAGGPVMSLIERD